MSTTFVGTPQFRFEETSITGTITIAESAIGTIGPTDLVCALWYSTDVQLTPPSNLPLKFSWTDANGGRWGYYERTGSGGTQYVFTEQYTHAHSIAMWAVAGADTTTGFLPNTPPTNSYSTGADSTFVAPGITTSQPNSLVLAIYEFIFHNSIASPPFGMTALGISATTAGTGDCLAVFYKTQAVAGASGDASAGFSSGDLGAAFQMYVAPAITGPTITAQPTNQQVPTGSTATFSVSATASGGSLSYQWQSSPDASTWTNIGSATSASYTTGTLTTSDSGTYYRCVVTDSNGSTNSNPALLVVSVAGARLLRVAQAVPAQTWGWSTVVVSGTALSPSVGHGAFSGHAPSLTQTITLALSPALGHLSLSGHAPSLTQTASQSISPGLGHGVFSGHAAAITQTANSSLSPLVGHAQWSGYAPVVVQSAAQYLSPVAGHGAFTGHIPSLGQTANQAVSPAAGHGVLTGYAPSLTQTSTSALAPVTGHVQVTGHAPSLAQTGSWTLSPTVGHLTSLGYTPTLTQTGSATMLVGGGASGGHRGKDWKDDARRQKLWDSVAADMEQALSPAPGHEEETPEAKPVDIRNIVRIITPTVPSAAPVKSKLPPVEDDSHEAAVLLLLLGD